MEIAELIRICTEFMTNHLSKVKIPNLPESERIYRIEHSVRVAKYATYIAQSDGYDVLKCALAAILHDIGKFESNCDKEHGRESAKIAQVFLSTLGLDAKQVDDICYCIACHCDKQENMGYGFIKEAVVIQDADNIDRYGVYRIIQALHYNGFDKMDLRKKVDFCQKRISMLENPMFMYHTVTGEKLFNQARHIQLDYFRLLKEELEYTLTEVNISDKVMNLNLID